MARKITWTKEAKEIYKKILEFYIERNNSNAYSRKLDKEITGLIELLPHYPYLGKKAGHKDLRAIIHGDHKIFYKVTKQEINIRLIWDCRRNPKDLKL